MSIESPLIKMTNLSSFTISFYLGLFLFISANLPIIQKGVRHFKKSYKIQRKGILISGFLTAAGNFLFIAAINHAGVANTVLILATTPIFSSILMWWLFKKRTSKALFIATFFVFVGLFIILKNSLFVSSFIGIVFAFLCMACVSFLFLTLNHYKHASRLGNIAVGGLFLTLFSLPFASLDVGQSAFVIIFALGLITMPLSRYLVGVSSKIIYANEMSLLLILESVLAPLWAWWWLDERPPLATFIGGSIILLSIVFYITKSKN